MPHGVNKYYNDDLKFDIPSTTERGCLQIFPIILTEN